MHNITFEEYTKTYESFQKALNKLSESSEFKDAKSNKEIAEKLLPIYLKNLENLKLKENSLHQELDKETKSNLQFDLMIATDYTRKKISTIKEEIKNSDINNKKNLEDQLSIELAALKIYEGREKALTKTLIKKTSNDNLISEITEQLEKLSEKIESFQKLYDNAQRILNESNSTLLYEKLLREEMDYLSSEIKKCNPSEKLQDSESSEQNTTKSSKRISE